MADINAAFDAMMANVAAPPISLDEFRVFVSRDPKAKNALAFCEWYQRYREVYFDRTATSSTGYAAAIGMRAEIPHAFVVSQQAMRATTDRISMRSVSVPNLCVNELQLQTMAKKIYTLKSHSFSMLSESMIDSAFNTTSTGHSNSTGASRGQVSFSLSADQSALSGSSGTTESFRCVQEIGGYCKSGRASVYRSKDHGNCAENGNSKSRRFTCTAVIDRYASGGEAQKQEDYRLQLQSLLIYECWMRFLCAGSAELPFVSDIEILYIKERLPLNLTQMLHPLLCNSDMLEAPSSLAACVASTNYATTASGDPSVYTSPGPSKRDCPTTSRLVSQRSLQFQPYEQLKRNLMTQIRIKRLNMLHKNTPADSGVKAKDLCGLHLDAEKHSCGVGKRDAESSPDVEMVTAKEFFAGLRRISTMPTLKHHEEPETGAMQNLQGRPKGEYRIQQPLPTLHPSFRVKRLLSMRAVQNIHHSLRPHPPTAAAKTFESADIRDCSRISQLYGYQPIPQSMAQLIIPTSVPPALFDTAAKLAADYLLQSQFNEFYRLAHCNMTAREQRNVLAGSLVLLVLGLAVSAVVMLLKLSILWRIFAVPMLLLSLLFMTEACTRVSIILWLKRCRSTALVLNQHVLDQYNDYDDMEKRLQSEQAAGIDIQAVQAITGTLRPSSVVGFAGTIYNTGCCSVNRRCRFCSGSSNNASSKGNAGLNGLSQTSTSSTLSLWSHMTIGSAICNVFDRLVCFMLRKRNVGDQWHIDFRVQRYEVVERHVIRGQSIIVCHQLCVLLVFWTAVLLALFFIA
ncbi:hypothetical protein IWW45_007508 [Coemansia sp. RSA 485]|nr:hypothetical protein IWW45_007508 [Coemansia sp. RSA 485]